MKPTDEMCRMLNELGIKYTIDDSNDYEIVEWQGPYNLWWQFVYDPYEEEPYGELRLQKTGGAMHLTPEQAIAATVGMEKWEPSKEWKAWHNSLKHDNPTSIREAVENILYEAIDFGGDMGPNGNVWSGVDEGIVLTENCIDGWVESVESIAAMVGADEDETDARDLMEAIRDDDGVRYSMDEVLDIMRKDVAYAECRSCASCPEMDNPDSYISLLQSALKWHNGYMSMPTNPRNTCVVLEGENPPEEVLFIHDEGGVTHYLPEATCHLEECEHEREVPYDLPDCDSGWYTEVTYDCDECGYENVDPNIRFCGGCGRRVVAE